MIDLMRIEFLCREGFDRIELTSEVPELVAWIREAVRELKAHQSDLPYPDREVAELIARVKL